MRFDRKEITLEQKAVLTLGEAAAIYCENVEVLRKLLQTGAIPADFDGKKWEILRSHLEDYYRGRNEAATTARKRVAERAAA